MDCRTVYDQSDFSSPSFSEAINMSSRPFTIGYKSIKEWISPYFTFFPYLKRPVVARGGSCGQVPGGGRRVGGAVIVRP